MSGEIIQMSHKQNLIFEPEDLEQASPATVSRCGMIYMEPHQLGWRPMKESYMETLPASLTQEHKELVNDLFEWLFDPCLCKYQLELLYGVVMCLVEYLSPWTKLYVVYVLVYCVVFEFYKL